MDSPPIGLRAFDYYLPSKKVCLEELQEQGKLSSDPETLRALGWRHAYIASKQDAFDLASHALRGLFARGIQPESIDILPHRSQGLEDRLLEVRRAVVILDGFRVHGLDRHGLS